MGKKARLKRERRAQALATTPVTSIVIPVRNNPELTRQCLQAVAAHTPESHEIVLVDNGSDQETQAILAAAARRAGNIRLISNGYNLGFPASVNQGIAAAQGEHILLLNNDVMVTAGWLGRMLAATERDPAIGLVGPRADNVSGQQAVPVSPTVTDFDAFARAWAARYAGQGQEVERLVGFALLIRREVVEKIGGMDPRFGLGNFEDDDYCRRAKLAGFKLWQADDVILHHVGSATFQSEGIDLGKLLRGNELVFEAKWRESPDLFIPLGDGRPRPKPRISLCMIVRDEERFLAGCLDSVKGIVDEIVVVNTGSTDRTVEIARRYGARIGHFEWCDDFAAPRNASLDLATGDWILVLDADERLTDEGRKSIPDLVNVTPENICGFDLGIQSNGAFFDPDARSSCVRLFRKGYRFVEPLHEAVNFGKDTIAGLPDVVMIEHLGYTPEVWAGRRKYDRNMGILRRAVATGRATPHIWYQLGRTGGNEPIEEQIGWYQKAVTASLADPKENAGLLQLAVPPLVELLISEGRQSEAVDSSLEALESVHSAGVPDLPDVVFAYAHALRASGRFDDALKASIRAYNSLAPTRYWQYIGPLSIRHCLGLMRDCTDSIGVPPVRLVPLPGGGVLLHNDPYPALPDGAEVIRHGGAAPTLSLLILSLTSRAGLLETLQAELLRQSAGKPVEILILVDDGELTTGAKRNWLKASAAGERIVFVDDDDRLAGYYVASILDAIEQHPDADCITFGVMRYVDGRPDRPAWYSKTFLHEDRPDRYHRKPNHLMVFRSEVARFADFPDARIGEDTAWAAVVSSFIRKEARIEKILYHYRDRSAKARRAAPPRAGQ